MRALAPPEIKFRQRRKSHADEIGSTAESAALNATGHASAGVDCTDLFRHAAGSVSELTTALRIALDRGRAMRWRLTTDRTRLPGSEPRGAPIRGG